MAINPKHFYDKEISLPVHRVLDMCRVAERDERAKIVAWLRKSADDIIGNTLSGDYVVDQCMMAAEAIEIAANDIEAGEHLK